MPTSVTARAPAKINLSLAVGRRRADGYHSIATVFHAVGLWDEVTATPAGGLEVSVTGPEARGVPTGPDNLAARAATLLAARAGVRPDVRLHVTKQIPVAGGLAGGSADAAAALVACDALWGLAAHRDVLLSVAAQVGSDVPFALVGGTAMGTGRGERLTPALARGRFSWVLAVAGDGLSTPAVYAELDRLRGPARGSPLVVPPELMTALRTGDAAGVGACLHNDLQRPALSLRPALRKVLDVGEDYGALGAVVSGSGPTCALLARDDDHALDLAVALTSSGTCRSVARAPGPVPGARVVPG